MRSRLLSSSFWAITGNGSQYLVVFLLLVYLARILEPGDFGLMATASVGLDLGTRIARWGQVELLQQKRWQTDEARNQSLRLSLLIALLCCGLFVAVAEPLARHFHSRQLAWMIYLCAPVFLFSATSSTAEAVLRAEFRFRTLAIRSTVATLVGAVVAIALANLGFGALTLAVQRLVQAAVSGVWIWSSVDWRPSFRRGTVWSRPLASEGAHVMIGTLLPVAVPRSIDLMVGLFMGPVTLGLMRLAFRINEFAGQMLIMPLVSVANAELSHHAHDLDALRRSYLRLTQAIAILTCPMLIGLSLTAREAIPFICGPKWTASIPFVEVIGLLGLVAPINYHFAQAMVALKQSRLVMRQGVAQIVLGLLLALAAVQISLVAIAIAHVLRGAIISLLNVRDLRRHMGLRIGPLVRAMAPPYLATLGMSLAILAARMPGEAIANPTQRLLLLSLVGATTYAAMLRLCARAGLWPDYHLLVDRLIPRRLRKEPVAG